MQDTTIKVLEVEVNYQTPATSEEFDTLAGKVGATLEMAVKQELFHGAYGDIRSGVADGLIKLGHERKALKTEERESTDEEGNVTTETVVTKWETEAVFFKRICATEGVEPTHFKDLIQEVALATPFDPSKKERSVAAKKIAKTHLECAQAIAAEGGLEHVAGVLADLLSIDVDVSMGGEDAIENLARAISINEQKEKKALANKYTNL